jgi:hypothetical protein
VADAQRLSSPARREALYQQHTPRADGLQPGYRHFESGAPSQRKAGGFEAHDIRPLGQCSAGRGLIGAGRGFTVREEQRSGAPAAQAQQHVRQRRLAALGGDRRGEQAPAPIIRQRILEYRQRRVQQLRAKAAHGIQRQRDRIEREGAGFPQPRTRVFEH